MKGDLLKGRWFFSVIFLFLVCCGSSSQYERFSCKNRLRVVLNAKNSPVTSAVFWIGSGEAYGSPRLAEITIQMLLRGTEIRTGTQVHQEIESLGGRIGVETTMSSSILYVQAPPKTFLLCFKILCECISQPTFEESELRQIIIRKREGIEKRISKSWEKLSHDAAIRAILFQNTPVGRSPEGGELLYARQDVVDFYHSWVKPSNMVLAVVGRFRERELLKEIRSLWASEGSMVKHPLPHDLLGEMTHPRELIVSGESPRDHVLIGFRAPKALSESFFATSHLEALLASGRSSWLPRCSISEDKMDYSIESYYEYEWTHGYFVIHVEVPPGSAMEAKSWILEKLEHIENQSISQETFNIAKRKVISHLSYQYQYTLPYAIFLALSTYVDSPYNQIAFLEKRIEQTSPDEVCQTAKRLFMNPGIWISKGKKIR
jgi:zinc protease